MIPFHSAGDRLPSRRPKGLTGFFFIISKRTVGFYIDFSLYRNGFFPFLFFIHPIYRILSGKSDLMNKGVLLVVRVFL